MYILHQQTSAVIITFEITKKQHIFTFVLFLCIKKVKLEHFSLIYNPSPATRVCLEFFLINGRHHTGRSYFLNIMVEKGVETRINKMSKYDC